MRKLMIILTLLLVIALPVSGMSIQMNYCDDIEQYDDLMKKLSSSNSGFKVPNNFVYWDDISCLGDFDFCHLFQLVSYYYSVDDGYDSFLISVDHAPEKDPYHIPIESYPSVPISQDMTSMRFASPSDGMFRIDRDGIIYVYDKSGELFSINWYKDGAELTLYTTELAEYPNDATNTALGRLLSVSDSEFNKVRIGFNRIAL